MDGDGKQNWCFMVSKLRLHGTMQQGLCFYTYVISKILSQIFSDTLNGWTKKFSPPGSPQEAPIKVIE